MLVQVQPAKAVAQLAERGTPEAEVQILPCESMQLGGTSAGFFFSLPVQYGPTRLRAAPHPRTRRYGRHRRIAIPGSTGIPLRGISLKVELLVCIQRAPERYRHSPEICTARVAPEKAVVHALPCFNLD